MSTTSSSKPSPIGTGLGHVPAPLPPTLNYDAELVALLSGAERALGALNGIGRIQPNPTLLVFPYMHREAVVSSRIEGTQASLADVLLLEAGQEPPEQPGDTREVLNYVSALRNGVELIRTMPLHLNLIRDMHRTLMTDVRGRSRDPGEFRRIQVWIGAQDRPLQEATYVPPPVPEMLRLLDQWEKYLNTPDEISQLVKCALLHYQFEAIHPFLDGNGRIGRLINILFLLQCGVLEYPLLYLSGYFDLFRTEYYSRLRAVTETMDWTGWIKYFARAVQIQAISAVKDCERLLAVLEDYRRRVKAVGQGNTLRSVLELLMANPFVTARQIEKELRVTYKTANSAIARLVDASVLHEVTGRPRNRVYVAQELLSVVQGDANK